MSLESDFARLIEVVKKMQFVQEETLRMLADRDELDEAEAVCDEIGEAESWAQDFVREHPELDGWESDRDGSYVYSYCSRPSDGQVLRGLMRAAKERPDGVSSRDVLCAMYGTLDEAVLPYDQQPGCWSNYLGRMPSVVANILASLTHAGAATRVRKRTGSLPTLWTVAPQPDDGCHSLMDDGRFYCDGTTSSPVTEHSADECDRAGHARCAICAILVRDAA